MALSLLSQAWLPQAPGATQVPPPQMSPALAQLMTSLLRPSAEHACTSVPTQTFELGSHTSAQSCGQVSGDSVPVQSPSPQVGPVQSSAHAKQPTAPASHAARSVPSQRPSPHDWSWHSAQTMASFDKVATPQLQGEAYWQRNWHVPLLWHWPVAAPLSVTTFRSNSPPQLASALAPSTGLLPAGHWPTRSAATHWVATSVASGQPAKRKAYRMRP